MGLLEEAIREHLELKRQHGADPGTVSEQEREVLGPVQRGVEPLVVEDEVVEEEEILEADVVEEAPEDAPGAMDDPIAPVSEEPAAGHESEIEPPQSSTAFPETVASPPADSTAPFDVEDEPFAPDRPEPEPEEDEDVLEETPEFLQETPEHDRLWFEQKPPRDFDFDR
jgi:hypothetical protein